MPEDSLLARKPIQGLDSLGHGTAGARERLGAREAAGATDLGLYSSKPRTKTRKFELPKSAECRRIERLRGRVWQRLVTAYFCEGCFRRLATRPLSGVKCLSQGCYT